jgi:hypothetical protein
MYDGTNNPNDTTTTTIADNTWAMITFVRDVPSGKIKLYINGSFDSEITDTTTSTPSYSVFGIGEDRSSTDRPFVGSVDEMGLWSRALSSTEISELYNNGDGYEIPLGATFIPQMILT